METPEQRIARVLREEIGIVPYDPTWPESFRREAEHLRACLPAELLGRIEHFGSTAVPGLAAKPIVDMLVEVTDLEAARERIAPVLESQGYDYFWRPTHGEDGPPFYAWFIKRDPGTGARTHHIHMVERRFSEHWDRIRFREYLIGHPEAAAEYARLKRRLAAESPRDRIAYTRGKSEFIASVMARAFDLRTEPRPGDLGELIRLHGVLYAQEYGFDATFEAYVAGPLADFALAASSRERLWIAERGGRMVGSVAIVSHTPGIAQLRWFLVDPSARGAGLGTRLLREAVAFSRTQGYRSVILWTVRSLEAAAHLYRSAGFVKVEERPGKRWGVDVIEERYELRLDSPQ